MQKLKTRIEYVVTYSYKFITYKSIQFNLLTYFKLTISVG